MIDWSLKVAQIGIAFMIILSVWLTSLYLFSEEEVNSADCEGTQEIRINKTEYGAEVWINCIPGKGGVYLGND